MKKVLSILMMVFLVFNMASCKSALEPKKAKASTNLTDGEDVKISEELKSRIKNITLYEEDLNFVSKFGLSVLKETFKEDGENNILISPLSICIALAMCTNGADTITLGEMQDVLSMDANGMNKFFYDYMKSKANSDEEVLKIANSIWIKDTDNFEANKDFLAINKDVYSSEVYMADFSNTTLKDINFWVENNTGGLIKNILDNIDKDAIMYLINTLLFEARWEKEFEREPFKSDFHLENGKIMTAKFMSFEEHDYLSSDNFTGFIKYYDGRKYGFVGILPNEGMKMADFIANLKESDIEKAMQNVSNEKVEIKIPKFKSRYKKELKEVLKSLGMLSAFTYETADFTKMGELKGEGLKILISRVIHESYIDVNEIGTKAGAATVVEMKCEGAMMEEKEPKMVFLDRPFVYMIWDFENNVPIFIGDVMEVSE